uniref:Apple domain-containing protein n=1 Tax=Meloidogyne incognita TaxID=6306 RepID=A0A914MZJ1_MELIC
MSDKVPKDHIFSKKQQSSSQSSSTSPTSLSDACFVEQPGYVLEGMALAARQQVSPQLCKCLCAIAEWKQLLEGNESKNNVVEGGCKSSQFYKNSGTCLISGENRVSAPERFSFDENSSRLNGEQQSSYLDFRTSTSTITTTTNLNEKEEEEDDQQQQLETKTAIPSIEKPTELEEIGENWKTVNVEGEEKRKNRANQGGDEKEEEEEDEKIEEKGRGTSIIKVTAAQADPPREDDLHNKSENSGSSTTIDSVTATTTITTPITVILWSRNWKIFGSSVLRTENFYLKSS